MTTSSIGRRPSPYQFVMLAGAAFWILSMLLQTGSGGIVALWTSVVFLVALVLVTSATRTVTLRSLVTLYFAGGALFAVAVAAGKGIDLIDPDLRSPWQSIGIPFLEETLKILPVLILLLRRRAAQTLTLGASDVLLMAAVTASGFALVEDAFIRHHGGWTQSLAWLPTTQIVSSRHGDHLIAGHAIWGAIAGAAIGIALLVARPARLALPVGVSGVIWSLLDHVANNYDNKHSDALASTLKFLTADGWVTAFLLVMAVSTAVLLDAYVAYAKLPRLPELARPPIQLYRAQDVWTFERMRRMLGYAIFRAGRATGMKRAWSTVAAASLDQSLREWPRLI